MRRAIATVSVASLALAVAYGCSLDWTYVEPAEAGADGAPADAPSVETGAADADASPSDAGPDAVRFACGPLTCTNPPQICLRADNGDAAACQSLGGCTSCACLDGVAVCGRLEDAAFVSCQERGGATVICR